MKTTRRTEQDKAQKDQPAKRSKTKRKLTQSERLSSLEEIALLLLQASLRGHLLPSERKIAKNLLESRKAMQIKKISETNKDPRCPVCRQPLARPRVRRCPWCGILLVEARKGLKQALEEK